MGGSKSNKLGRMKPSDLVRQGLATADDRLGSVLDELIDELRRVPGLVGVAVGGSIGEGTADPFSDLDLECIFDPASPQTGGEVRAAIARVVKIGDERWSVPGRILSTVAVDWIRVDVTVLARHEPISAKSIVVWAADDAEFRRAPAPAFVADPAALTATVTRFLRSIGLLVRDTRRGDLRLGCWATEFLVNELIDLMYLERGLVRGAQKGTFARLPQRDVEVLQRLPVAAPDPRSVVEAQLAVADEYLVRARRLCGRWGATWPDEMVVGTRTFLLRHLGETFYAP